METGAEQKAQTACMPASKNRERAAVAKKQREKQQEH